MLKSKIAAVKPEVTHISNNVVWNKTQLKDFNIRQASAKLRSGLWIKIKNLVL